MFLLLNLKGYSILSWVVSRNKGLWTKVIVLLCLVTLIIKVNILSPARRRTHSPPLPQHSEPKRRGHQNSLKVTNSGQSQLEGHHYGSFNGIQIFQGIFKVLLNQVQEICLGPSVFFLSSQLTASSAWQGSACLPACRGQSCRSLTWESEAL